MKIRIICLLWACLPVAGASLWALEIDGTVVATDPGERTLTLTHDGWGDRPAGETRFSVGHGDAVVYDAGDRIRGTISRYGGGFRLERIWPDDRIQVKVMNDTNRRLRQDTVIRGSQAYRSVGEYVPDFAFFDQQGELVTARSLRGRKWVVNFIFTCCQTPEMCPAATQRMIRLQGVVEEAGLEDVSLISVSFDPEYDTPGILAEYASSRGAQPGNFHFLTGEPQAVDDLMRQFGILTQEADGTIVHNMATLIVDERGRIIHRKDGSTWSVEDFLGRLAQGEAAFQASR